MNTIFRFVDRNTTLVRRQGSGRTNLNDLSEDEEHYAGVVTAGSRTTRFSSETGGVRRRKTSISRKYNDFETIDWQKDLAHDHNRHRLLLAEKKASRTGWIKYVFDAWSGWICVFFIGVLCGLVIGSIDIGTTWLADTKEGVCLGAFWLNREQCCWAQSDVSVDEENTGLTCGSFKTWPQLVSITSEAGSYIFSYTCFIFLAVLFAWLASMFPRVFAPYASGSGVAEIKTILSGYVMHNFLGKLTLITKSISLILAVASGMCLGKEGPMVHVGCCVGNIVASFFPKYSKNQAKRREILSAACAAGVACAFDAPVGGVLFSLEEVSYFFPLKTLWRSFFCTMIAVLTVQLMNPYGTEKAVQFKTEYDHPWDSLEILPFILLGILGGIWGALFVKLNVRWCQFRRNSALSRYPVTEVVGLALLSAVVAYPNVYTRMDTAKLISILVSQCNVGDTGSLCDYNYKNNMSTVTDESSDKIPHVTPGPGISSAMWQLSLALLVKCLLLVITIGSKIPAGLYIPSMACGAIMGRMVGIGLQYIIPVGPEASQYVMWGFCMRKGNGGCINPGLYAMIGAAGALAGTTRMTVALVVIMYELTGGIRYITPLMTVVMFAKWVADAIDREGINEAVIRMNGYPYLDNKEVCEAATTAAEIVANQSKLEMFSANDMTVRDVRAVLKSSRHTGFPVVTDFESRTVVGFVARKDCIEALNVIMDDDGLDDDNNDTQAVVGNGGAESDDKSAGPERPTDLGTTSTTAPISEDLYDACLDLPTHESKVIFVDIDGAIGASQPAGQPHTLEPVVVRDIVDLAPTTFAEQTPTRQIFEAFCKLGLRQALITRNGKLRGIVTRKDLLSHLHLEKEPRSSGDNPRTSSYNLHQFTPKSPTRPFPGQDDSSS